MKKYTQASTKGFTLVELIVVIVILAILSTIAFLSFSSQSASARDSKRKTDLSNIASKMNIAAAQGTTFTNMITVVTNKFATGNLAGTGTTSSMIVAGTVNFAALGVNGTDFADPILPNAYAAASTKYAGSVFQLASKIENDEGGNPVSSGAFLVGNYSKRTQAATIGSGTSTTAGTITLSGNLIGQYKTYDEIVFDVGTGTVTSVSADQTTIKVSGITGTGANKNIKLNTGDEVASLIRGLDGLPVSTTNAPY